MKTTLIAIFVLCSTSIAFAQTADEPALEKPTDTKAGDLEGANDEGIPSGGGVVGLFGADEEGYVGGADEFGDEMYGGGEPLKPPRPIELNQASIANALAEVSLVTVQVNDKAWSKNNVAQFFDDIARKQLAIAILNSLKRSDLDGDLVVQQGGVLVLRYSPKSYEDSGRFIPNVINALEGPAQQRMQEQAERKTKLLPGDEQPESAREFRRLRLESADATSLGEVMRRLLPDLLFVVLEKDQVLVLGSSADVRTAEEVMRQIDERPTAKDGVVIVPMQDTPSAVQTPYETSQLSKRLRSLQFERLMLAQYLGSNHPQLVKINQEILALETFLKSAPGPAVSNSDTSMPGIIAAAKSEYEQAERSAATIAKTLRAVKKDSGDSRRIQQLRQELQSQVQSAFNLRMQLQQAQLADAEMKLKVSRDRLFRRQQISEKIIERRVEELESGEDTSWLSSADTERAAPGSSASARRGSPDPAETPTAGLPARGSDSVNLGGVPGQVTRAQEAPAKEFVPRVDPANAAPEESTQFRLSAPDGTTFQTLGAKTLPDRINMSVPGVFVVITPDKKRLLGELVTTASTDAGLRWLQHNAVPIQLTQDQIDQVIAGKCIRTVVALATEEDHGSRALQGITTNSSAYDSWADTFTDTVPEGPALAVVKLRREQLVPSSHYTTKITFETDESAETLDDGSIQFSLPAPGWSQPTLHFTFEQAVAIDTIRLTFLPDTRFKDNRLGRQAEGRELRIFEVRALLLPATTVDPAPLRLRNGHGRPNKDGTLALSFLRCIDSESFHDDTTGDCIDFATDTGWLLPELKPGQQSHTLLFQLEKPIRLAKGEQLDLIIDTGGNSESDVVSRVRVAFDSVVEKVALLSRDSP